MEKIQPIILAGGRGRRMNSDLPKVLLPLQGKPLLAHLLAEIAVSNLKRKPLIVVGYGANLVKNAIGQEYSFALQENQLGTGHAVLSAEQAVEPGTEHILVLYGDHPLVTAQTINSLAEAHLENDAPLTMGTIQIPNFEEWRAGFFDFGRVIRNGGGTIDRIIEKKDASETELQVTDLNPSYFCFKADWLWHNLKKIKNNNARGEYYLTDLPHIAKENGEKIATVMIEPIEALGANTPEQLAILELMLANRTK